MITFSPKQTQTVAEICVESSDSFPESAIALLHRLTFNTSNTVELNDFELYMLWDYVRYFKVGKWGELRDKLIAKYYDSKVLVDFRRTAEE